MIIAFMDVIILIGLTVPLISNRTTARYIIVYDIEEDEWSLLLATPIPILLVWYI